MIKQKSNFLIRFRKEDEGFIDLLEINNIYQEVKNFFNSKVDINPIRLCFVYSPEEFIFFSGRDNLENWMVGQVTYPNKVIVFSPSVVEKYTIHRKESIKGVIAHEISHLFYGGLKYPNLRLINEGIAKHFNYKFDDNEPKEPPYIENCKLQLKGQENIKEDYMIGYFLIQGILKENDGREKLFNFLSFINNEDTEELVKEKFKKIFGVTPKELIKIKGGKENGKIQSK